MLLNIALAVALLAGLTLTVAVLLQKTKSDGFSAAMGGENVGRYTPGSKEEWLDKIARAAAVIWVIGRLSVAVLWYKHL